MFARPREEYGAAGEPLYGFHIARTELLHLNLSLNFEAFLQREEVEPDPIIVIFFFQAQC